MRCLTNDWLVLKSSVSVSLVNVTGSFCLDDDAIFKETILVIAHNSIARPDGHIQVITLNAIFVAVICG